MTSVGGDIGRDALRCFQAHPSPIELYGIDMDPYAAGQQLVKGFDIAPSGREEAAYLSFIQKKIEEWDIDVICPISEVEIQFFDKSRALFKNTPLMMQSHSVLEISLDKFNTAEWLKSQGLPHPQTQLFEHYSGGYGWPVIVKDRQGYGRHSVHLANNEEELSAYASRLKRPIVQKYLGQSDQEYTMGLFAHGKEIREIQFLRTLGFGSLSKTAELVNEKELSLLARDIAIKLNLQGSLNVQLRKTPEGFVPFEINPRLSSTVYLRHCFDFSDANWWLESFDGSVSPYVPPVKRRIAVRTMGEIFFDIPSK